MMGGDWTKPCGCWYVGDDCRGNPSEFHACEQHAREDRDRAQTERVASLKRERDYEKQVASDLERYVEAVNNENAQLVAKLADLESRLAGKEGGLLQAARELLAAEETLATQAATLRGLREKAQGVAQALDRFYGTEIATLETGEPVWIDSKRAMQKYIELVDPAGDALDELLRATPPTPGATPGKGEAPKKKPLHELRGIDVPPGMDPYDFVAEGGAPEREEE